MDRPGLVVSSAVVLVLLDGTSMSLLLGATTLSRNLKKALGGASA